MNLANKPPGESELKTAAPVEVPKQKPNYPSFSIRDEVMDQFLKAHPVDLDDELVATVKLTVSGLSKESYGRHLQFDVVDMSKIRAHAFEDKEPDEQFEQLKDEAEEM